MMLCASVFLFAEHTTDTTAPRKVLNMPAAKRYIAVLTGALAALFATFLAVAGASQAAPCAYSNCTSVSVSTTNPAVGATITVAGNGFGANDTVDITLHTTTYNLGTATTNSSGSFSTSVTLPAGVSGQHTLTVTDPTTSQSNSVVLTIGAAGAPSGGTSTGGGLSSTGVAVISLGALGVILLAGGAVMLFAGRRRRVSA